MAKSKSREIASWDVNVWFKGWSLGYRLTTLLINLWFYIYYRRVYWQNYNKIDWSKPILIVSNHQNAFLDALLVLMKIPEQIYFMARADVFLTPVGRFFLKMYHLIPIFRKQDDVDIQEANQRIFNLTYNMLGNGRSILIFPEGNCIPRNTLRKFQKGTARMAFGAMEAHNFDLDLQIVPVGVNYSAHTSFRGDVHIKFGTQRPVSDYLTDYHDNPAKGILNLTRDMQQDVGSLVVDVPDTDNRPLVNFALNMAAKKKRWKYWGATKLKEINGIRKRVGDRLAELFNNQDPSYQKFLGEVENYREKIENSGVEDETVFKASKSNLFPDLVMKVLLLLLISPLAIPGWLIHLLPLRLIDKKAMNVNDEQFISSIRFAFQMVIFPLLHIIITAIVALFTGWSIYLLAILIGLPITLIAYLRAGLLLKEVKEAIAWIRLKRKNSTLANELITQREAVVSQLNTI